MNLGDLGEFGFLARMRSWLSGSREALGFLDDAAVIDLPDAGKLVATVDTLIERRHFRLDWSKPADVGWKAVSVNVSDLAAMGARPMWLLLSLGAAADTQEHVLKGVYGGMEEAAREYRCALVGGDTVRTQELTLAVTALGLLEGEPMTRAGARPGDVLAVTGPLGRAAAGVNLLMSQKTRGLSPEAAEACLAAHRRPRPRVDEGLALQRSGVVHAAMDLSDGLLSDVRRLAEASRTGIELDASRVPIAHEAAHLSEVRGWDPLQLALAGGEDFELLVALPEDGLDAPDVGLTRVGVVVKEGLWLIRDGRREPLPPGGWDHFTVPGPG